MIYSTPKETRISKNINPSTSKIKHKSKTNVLKTTYLNGRAAMFSRETSIFLFGIYEENQSCFMHDQVLKKNIPSFLNFIHR